MNFKSSLILAGAAMGMMACSTIPAAADQTPSAPGASADHMKAFPAAAAGQKQHVIQLPAVSDEDSLKLELIVGKTMTIDCNNHRFGGSLTEKTAEGWGYNYYTLDNLGAGVSTLMGCPPGSERTDFVRSSAETLIRYNSRLPVVVYTPADVEVRYRVWRASDEQIAN